jgi:hypothetical protein
MLGAIDANSTSPATDGDLLRCKTSIGKAIVDIRLQNIDMEVPAMRVPKPLFFLCLRAAG